MMNVHVSAVYLKNEHALQDDRAGQAELLCNSLAGRDETRVEDVNAGHSVTRSTIDGKLT